MSKYLPLIRVIFSAVFMVLTFMMVFSISAQNERTHTVRPGDTLQSIATFYESSVEAIAARNGIIDANQIRVGQQLIIPAPGTNINVIVRTYTVQPGDRLDDIAVRFNTTEDALMRLNSITNPNFISIGEVLEIPPLEGVISPGAPEITNPNNPGQTSNIYTTINGYYLVRYGDTLASIARGFNADMYNIARANGILNLNSIYAGTYLFIPGR